MYQQAQHELQTVRDFLRWAASQFERRELYFGHGTDNAWDESVALISQMLLLPQGVDAVILDAKLTSAEKQLAMNAIEQRIEQRIPVPYITGKAWFCDLPFVVNPAVLIPRSPIGELIRGGFQPWLATAPQRILDMCCGSACIGIALSQYFVDAAVDCADISAEALAVAEQNIVLHDCGDRVSLKQSATWQTFTEQDVYDLIVVNPPYVDAADFASMPVEFTHEPALALSSGEDGLDFTREFFQRAEQHLSDDGLLVFEVGNSGAALEQRYPDIPFTWVEFEHGGVGVFVMDKTAVSHAAGVFATVA